MSEYESLREDLDGIAAAMSRYAGAVSRYTSAADKAIKDLWTDNAELRDELHALANRVETLTRARLTEPAEVAEVMLDRDDATGVVTARGRRVGFTCTQVGCYITHPHEHTTAGVLYR